MGSSGSTASRRAITEKNNTHIASFFRFASFVKAASERRKSFSLERQAKMLSKMNPSGTIRKIVLAVGNCSIELPVAEFISKKILGFWTWVDRQVRYRITDFSVEPALFLI